MSTFDSGRLAVSLDFGRPLFLVVPLCAGLGSLIKGLNGVGEAVVFTTIWQLFYLAGVEETDNLGLLSALICVQQCIATISLAIVDFQQWMKYWRPGVLFAVCMMFMSPLGNYVRENAPTETINVVFSFVFFAFAVLKIIADGLKDMRKTNGRSRQPQTHAEPSAASTDAPSPSAASTDAPSSEGWSQADPSVIGATSEASNGGLSPRHLGWDDVSSASATPQASTDATAIVADPKPVVPTPAWLYKVLPGVGLSSGFFGGMSGMNGPPFILMVAFTSLDRDIARSIFPMAQLPDAWISRLPTLIALGHVKPEDAHLFAIGLVFSQLGLTLGNRLRSRVSQAAFERCILAFLVLSSVSSLGLMKGHPRAVGCLVAFVVVMLVRVLFQQWRSRANQKCI